MLSSNPEQELALDGIAIIGMAGRFPGAPDLDTFWKNLVEGKDTITRFDATELAARNTDAQGATADFVAARGVLDDAAMFDAEYFGIAPREADRMDPQHRVFLEVCSNALEDGGYVSSEYPGEIGLFAGCSLNTYLLANLAKDRAFLDELTGNYQVGEFQVALGNDKDFLTTRAAYKLNLRGPCVTVQSACATSLVAICQASQALLNFQCEMALAGGVSVTFPQQRGHVYQEGGIVSNDGHCRPFDAHATGTVFGHGVGVVLLKRLEDAVRDGDHIAAVIRGFAVNNDGSAKAGYMAPGVDGQARVIATAQAMAGIRPDTISYIEAHGTGTPLGDPIEVAALTKVFQAATDRTGFCTIGTAKGNVGHLDSAAGVTGVIKTALSMQHRTLPGLAHFEAPNPNIDLEESPFTFNGKTAAWTSAERLRAGVSAFGVGGVNAHLVLEEAPPQSVSSSARRQQVLCVSGRTEAAAQTAAANLGAHFAAHPKTSLADAAYTLACGRKAHEYRVAIAASDAEDAVRRLAAVLTPHRATPRTIAFQFSGQGTQFAGMGKALYDTEPVYQAVVDHAAELLKGNLGLDLRDLMFAAADDASAAAKLERTEFAQPAIYVTELALVELWKAWGITPSVMVGHSLGEYVAATVAGVLSREDALRLVAVRGRMMQALEPGAMISVPLDEDDVAQYVTADVCMAALNSPRASVLSGPLAAIAAIEATLTANGVASRRLRTSHAFHSATMDPMLAAFEAEVAKVTLRNPAIRYVSSVTGRWITADQATNPKYWAQQCRKPVRFRAAFETLLKDVDLVLEVGAGRTLTTLATQQLPKDRTIATIASFTQTDTVQDALAALWSAGAALSWTAYYAQEQRRRVSLPTYPFQRQLHWIEPPAAQEASHEPSQEADIPVMPAGPVAAPCQECLAADAGATRSTRLREKIALVLTELSGIETTIAEAEHQFLELGFDSLFLTQATQSLQKKFGVKLTFRQLMEQFSTIASLADYLDSVLPAEAFAPAPVVTAQPATVATMQPMERLLAEQMAAMNKLFAEQVAAMRTAAGLAPLAPATTTPAVAASAASSAASEVRFFRPAQAKASQELTASQQKYISALIARYEAKTPGSKRLTQAGRPQLADPRAVAGFRPQWKEMVYPLIAERAKGSRLWDVDGNEYIDIVNGYGCIMFGHSPDFVVEAAKEQLDRGVAIGPQTPLASEVAALICELTGNERVTFCNTGSEAVMAAIRVARTVTGRDKLVYFTGDYHGTFDEVLIRNTPRGSAPVAPGIPLANVTNVVVLDYGAQESLDYLRSHADEIAAVLIEPVQTRHPENKPFDFIRSIRTITERTGSAMILDEVVTGFRLAPGGVQEFLGIRADMCTYGKVIGGGHPIGVLSGKAMYLDALDGGAWQYGDDSGPEVGVTFFAGTFVRHPLAMAAARAVLRHLEREGPHLQQELNEKTAKLAESLDRFFVERGVPSRIHHFASWFYFTFPGDARLGSLFYYAMRAKGIHIQEGYPCFLTTAHTAADIAAIEAAFRETIVEMQEAGVLPREVVVEAPPARPAFHPAALAETPTQVAPTESQREVFLAAALNDEANCAFNESLTLHLRGAIRKDDFASAMATIFARHDALRSTISEDGEWLSIAATSPVSTEFVDLRGLSASQQTEALAAAAEHEAQTPFDMAHGPLVRSICYELADNHMVLMLTAHHIVLDGWSANQMLEEVGRVYSKGANADLAPLLPFSSYATRERQLDEAGAYVANEIYWVQKFQGRSPKLELPTDRQRPLNKSYRGRTLDGKLGADLYAEVKKASARTGCSLYVTLLSGFQLLLHRLTGQDEVVVGISTAGQSLIEDGSLVGHCVHFLPMLSELKPTMTAREHVRATKTALLDAYDHQEFTYGSLLRKLKLEREPGRLPLIEVQFNLERVGANVAFDGLQTQMRANPKHFVNTDLFLNVMETGSDLEFMCDYNSELFDEETLARWMTSWAELLKSGAAAPDTRVDELEVLGPLERSEVVVEWNRTAVDLGAFEAVHETFLARAERDPERIALECGDVVWTYKRLAEYASGLAAKLVAEGLERGGLVGICVERSAEMVGAVLAVTMAGGAYVPLDPRHPQERLQMVLDDAGAAILLTMRDLGLKTSAKALNLSQSFEAAPEAWQPAAIDASALAYVIYTSGSTGKPKGVAIEHGALVNLLRSMQREPGLSANDVLVAITTLSFDIAGLELLLPLLTGAKLVVATDAEVLDGRMLLSLLERAKATVLQATPGAWRILIDAGWTNALPLKALCGGEALPRELADKLLDRAGELWNVYGPTETTIWSSATRVARGPGSVKIGPPIPNTQFYVLDERRQPVPIGVTGELFIGGAGLARGYWNRPELTSEKFIANPFGEGRLYATGDLARWNDKGLIELLGRTDFQVKIRGYRIELAEIEAALMQHETVKEAAVVAHKSDDTGITRLVAYVAVGELASNVSDRLILELPARLSRTLPEYLVPNAFVVLPALPRNSHGKIDRRALPSADVMSGENWIASTAHVADYFAPNDVIERQLADIWQTTLGIPLISARANFFSLGVGSLAALRLITKMNRVFAMELGLASLISASTIESIAELIRKRFAPNTNSSLVPLQPKGTKPPLFIVHGVGGNVVNFYGLSMRVGLDQPVYGIQSQALVANQPALLHLKDMAAHYIADLRKVQPQGPYHLLGYSFGGTMVLEMAHQLRAAGQEVALLGMIDSKSKDYEEELAQMASVQTRINRRVSRFRGNTGTLQWSARVKYIYEKLTTRAIRFACMAAAALDLKHVPAFMRSAYDINYVAVHNYKVRPYDGKLILFRASWQGEEEGDYDLGWGSIFKQGVQIHDLPGDHERIFLEPNIDQLANSLREALAGS